MFLNENYSLLDEQLTIALRNWELMMKLYPNNSFDLNYKKQVLMF
jgi:hypothetical protein